MCLYMSISKLLNEKKDRIPTWILRQERVGKEKKEFRLHIIIFFWNIYIISSNTLPHMQDKDKRK